MRRRLPSLNALRAFEATARTLSFTAAAAELNVTQGAVSRHVRALEAEIGVELFIRSVRRIDLTHEGHVLLSGVRSALDQLEQSVGRVDRRTAGGVLTISALPTFAMNWLMPRLEDFSSANPAIEVHLLTGIGAVDFSREDTDLAIRVGNLGDDDAPTNAARIDLKMTERQEGWRAHRLMADELVPVGIASVMRGITSPGDLLKKRLLHMATRANAWPDYLGASGLAHKVALDGPRFGHYFMVIEAVRRGDGIAVVPKVLVEDDLASGRLVTLRNDPVRSAGSYYLLCREHQWHLPVIKAFRSWISDKARLYAAANHATEPAGLLKL
ncbi:LysR family transcriptional regulator [Citreicella sp. C3M06]|uniref:LysR substrate-binding domain-containing protein n=1 Tax=Citreicella sp. C3M06 TaxID=2841564 RepID=UPI001C091D1D|nr:LysR substrate-binding domain-containing protein [Citreicella sp. C3M06]MBU2961828.1 LysR family transcriptional regulator [Citreicella sp. C3M06]